MTPARTQRQEAFLRGLLLDSRVVDLPMAYTPTFVLLSPPEALIFQ